MILILIVLVSLASNLHPSYRNRITRDLLPFKSGITQEMIQAAAQQEHTCLVVIHDHKLVQPTCFLQESHY